MNIDWYDVSIKPEDVVKIQLKKIWEANKHRHNRPWVDGKSDDMKSVAFTLLAVFDDRDDDTGKVWDREVHPVGYREGGKWFYHVSSWSDEYSPESVSVISSWAFMPDAPKDILTEIQADA
jgi:hypothetical protein